MNRQFGLGLVVALMVTLGGCSESDSDALTNAQVFLTDAPAEDLDDFVLSISYVALFSEENGTEEVLYTGGNIQQDLLSLQMIQEMIASASFVAGTYDGLKLVVENISASSNGVQQTVSLAGGGVFPAVFKIVFDDPIAFLPGSQAMISLDYDVGDSVTDGGANSIVVESVIFADVKTKHIDLEDFEGTIQSINRNDNTFDVMVIESSGPGSAEPVGILTVQVESSTTYEGEDNTFVEGTALISLLGIGYFVEVEGSFDGGVVIAETIEVEEGGAGNGNLQFEGLVTSFSIDGPGGGTDTATVKILKVKNDSTNDLAGLTAVDIDLDGGSAVYHATLGVSPDVFDIDLGEKLEVQGVYDGVSVTASVVRLEKTRYRGTITAVDSGSISIASLTAERTSVTGLTSRTFIIQASTEISVDDVLLINASDLALGQEVKIKGARDVDSDTWVAYEIEREPGDFDGTRSDVSSISGSTFVMTADGSDYGLGNPVTLTIVVQQEAKILLVQNDTKTMILYADLDAQLSNLALTARVKVEGVLSGSDLLATEILLIP